MKKLFYLLFVLPVLFSCENPKLAAAEENLKEIKCKNEQVIFRLNHSLNTRLLGEKLGLQKELNEFTKIESDSTASCDSIKNSWSRFVELVHEKSK